MASNPFPYGLDPGRERGGCLGLLIGAGMILYLLIIVNAAIYASILTNPSMEPPEGIDPALLQLAPYLGPTALMGFLGLWGLLRWRRWGVVLVVAATVASFFIDTLIGDLFASYLFAPVMVAMVWLLRDKWRHVY